MAATAGSLMAVTVVELLLRRGAEAATIFAELEADIDADAPLPVVVVVVVVAAVRRVEVDVVVESDGRWEMVPVANGAFER